MSSLAGEEKILREIQSSVRMLETIRPASGHSEHQRIVYASHPVTSGRLMYQVLHHHGVKTVAQLNSIDGQIYRAIIQKNSENNQHFAQKIRDEGYACVIAPGPFFMKGWTQEHYMSLWRQVIERYAEVVRFSENWHYSNGCVQEFLIGLQSGKDLRSHDNSELRPASELQNIRRAIEQIEGWGIECSNICCTYRELELHVMDKPLYQPKTDLSNLLPPATISL